MISYVARIAINLITYPYTKLLAGLVSFSEISNEVTWGCIRHWNLWHMIYIYLYIYVCVIISEPTMAYFTGAHICVNWPQCVDRVRCYSLFYFSYVIVCSGFVWSIFYYVVIKLNIFLLLALCEGESPMDFPSQRPMGQFDWPNRGEWI